MKEDKSLIALKRAVKTMGVMLVVGTVGLFIVIFTKFQSSSIGKVKTVKGPCRYQSGEISVKRPVLSATTEGTMLTLLTRFDDGQQEVILIDLCSGSKVSSFVVSGD